MKKTRKHLHHLIVIFIFSAIWLVQADRSSAAENTLNSIYHLLIGSTPSERFWQGLNLSGDVPQGGKYSFYQISVQIDDGPWTSLSTFPGQSSAAEGSRYAFTVFPKTETAYRFQVSAGDFMGLMGEPSDDSPVFFFTEKEAGTPGGPVPIADAGPNLVVQTGLPVSLDASGSYDGATASAEGLVYHWELHEGAEEVILEGADTVSPTFTPNTSGSYTFRLQVDKAAKTNAVISHSPIRYVTVFVKDDPLNEINVDSGPGIRTVAGERVRLVGSISGADPAEIIAYQWEILNAEAIGSKSVIENADSIDAAFTPDVAGIYRLRLSVYTENKSEYSMLTISVGDNDSLGDLLQQCLNERCGYTCANTDLDGDGAVNGADMDLFLAAEGGVRGEEQYSRAADFNRDGRIDATDEQVIAGCWQTDQPE